MDIEWKDGAQAGWCEAGDIIQALDDEVYALVVAGQDDTEELTRACGRVLVLMIKEGQLTPTMLDATHGVRRVGRCIGITGMRCAAR